MSVLDDQFGPITCHHGNLANTCGWCYADKLKVELMALQEQKDKEYIEAAELLHDNSARIELLETTIIKVERLLKWLLSVPSDYSSPEKLHRTMINTIDRITELLKEAHSG